MCGTALAVPERSILLPLAYIYMQIINFKAVYSHRSIIYVCDVTLRYDDTTNLLHAEHRLGTSGRQRQEGARAAVSCV
jgi:hypothetical protein